jgi:ABC-type multidrug transport system fused ATPase/permease subunit
MKNFKKILKLLSEEDKKKLTKLLILVLLMALIDTAGVASIMPFIAVLTNLDLVNTNIYLYKLFIFSENFGVRNKEEYIFFLGLTVFFILIFSLSIKTITTYYQYRFLNNCEYNISRKLFEKYLNQPYVWFLNHNTSELGKNILSEVSSVIDQAIQPLIILCVYGSVSIALIALLIFINPQIAIITSLIFILAYGLIFQSIKRELEKIGAERLKYNKDRFIMTSEAFGGIKLVKLNSLEKFFISRFSKPAENYTKHQGSVQIISTLPRYLIEAISFGGIILLVLSLMSKTGDFSKTLSIISVYVFAGYRLMPAIQQIYWALSQLRFSQSVLEKFEKELLDDQNYILKKKQKKKIQLNKKIILRDITYTYPNTIKPVLINVNMEIQANTVVGITGQTGSGKTTLIDLILGLIEVQKGKIVIDEKNLSLQNMNYWQKILGYVPQKIYLSDESIYKNIAYGVDEKNIDKKRVQHVAKITKIHDFVSSELINGYETIVGERGSKLSGGQVQRIGIARALYNKPKVLILDEGTNSLDTLTEDEIMKNILNFDENITIIIVAHRLNTLKKCKEIFFLEKGRLSNKGSFNNLLIKNKKFSQMVKLMNQNK